MRVEVCEQVSDLHRRRWVFYFRVDYSGVRLVLDDYVEESRESTRKRTWIKGMRYTRIGDRRGLGARLLQFEDVPLPSRVVGDARKQLHEMINSLDVSETVSCNRLQRSNMTKVKKLTCLDCLYGVERTFGKVAWCMKRLKIVPADYWCAAHIDKELSIEEKK